jgi:hypothetical protein
MKLRKTAVITFVCLMVLVLVTQSLAGIIGTTGAVVDVTATPPASVLLGATQSDTEIKLFTERGGVTLVAPVNVDVSVPGTYNFPASAPYSPATLPAGTTVDSFFLHFDRVSTTGFGRLTGSVTVDCPIVGVIALTPQLDASDAALGRVGTLYPTGTEARRGLEFEEEITLSADRKTLIVTLEIQSEALPGGPGDPTLDQIRVITSCPPTGACPKTQGFWKTHAEAWPVSSLTLGSQTYTQAELLTILTTPTRGDASLILAKQLIAAKLNVANGADPTPVSATITHADALFSSFAGKLPYGVAPSSVTGQAMTADGEALDDYNNGTQTSGCNDR